MPVTDADVAALCCGIYAYSGDPAVTWDLFDDGSQDDGVCWGVKRVGDTDVIVFRGSVSIGDWFRDLMAIANIPWGEPRLGHVHQGFFLGMDQVWGEVRDKIGAKVIVAGHSLGAGRADILTALMALAGRPPIARVVFGEPKPGFEDHAAIVRTVPGRSYCCGDAHGHDLITDAPLKLPPEEYVRPTPLIRLTISPAPNDIWGVFRYHHARLYLEALKGASSTPTQEMKS